MIEENAWHLPRPTAFVFGGGAASTCTQVGMLAAVLEVGIQPDLVVGTSAGALNGVVLADTPEAAVERLHRIWTSCDRRTVIGDSRLRQLRNLLGGQFWFRGQRLAELFTTEVGARTFDELATPFACVATDLDSGEAIALRDGDLVDALLATCALPGVFPLVHRNNRVLADGGCVANVPIRQAIDLGAASLVVFDGRPRVPSRGPFRNVRDSMTAALAAALKQQYECDLDRARGFMPVLCVPGQPELHVRGFDFTNVPALIDAAHDAAQAYLAPLRVNVSPE
ncbi:patatin-like phospholipase family protein [Kutzneria sp. NPDC051319]|uniref:patatin-like phospholipase family protein n=1 Tax=Kutzneria sp. NPDC051319 TaxID=3155047 RepID=UPI003422D44E